MLSWRGQGKLDLYVLPSRVTSAMRCDFISLDIACGIGRCGGLTTRFHSYFTVPVTEFDIHFATLCVLIPISPYAACHNRQARRQAGHGPLLPYHTQYRVHKQNNTYKWTAVVQHPTIW